MARYMMKTHPSWEAAWYTVNILVAETNYNNIHFNNDEIYHMERGIIKVQITQKQETLTEERRDLRMNGTK